MKPISSIQSGLGGISGAIEEHPPVPGYEGNDNTAFGARTRTVWWGENPNILPDHPNYRPWGNGTTSSNSLDDDEIGFLDDDEFNPFFEIGSEADESFPGLGGGSGRRIDESVRLHGVDALGWYVSFHHPGPKWGIFVPVSGIAYLAKHVFGGLTATTATTAQLAFHAIVNHELFHFATDYAVAQAELDHAEPWYCPAKRAFRAAPPHYCKLEEQLANAYMLRAFRSTRKALKIRGKQAALRAFIAMQPEGYRDAPDVEAADWDPLLHELAKQFGSHSTSAASHSVLWDPWKGYDWAARFPIQPRINWRYCPIHLVDDTARFGIPPGWLDFFSRLTGIVESEDFTKKLSLLPPKVQGLWERTKQKLGDAITAGADFKKWPKGGADMFSVRLNSSYRAHLRYRKPTSDWLAVAVGNHKEMGHG